MMAGIGAVSQSNARKTTMTEDTVADEEMKVICEDSTTAVAHLEKIVERVYLVVTEY